MIGRVASLYRHPVKGFTPESLAAADLIEGRHFPGDRLYAVEDGPCGFDPATPDHISKMKFTVLARLAEVARVRTRWDESADILHVHAEGRAPLSVCLADAAGREAFAAWLTEFLGEAAAGPLKVLAAPEGHRFMDSRRGAVSVLNLASVRDLEARIGRPVDPLRFRANLYVEGWPAWVENGWTGRALRLGGAEAEVYKSIVRCAATGVDPATGERDMDPVAALYAEYGHVLCGVYVEVRRSGRVEVGDQVEIAA